MNYSPVFLRTALCRTNLGFRRFSQIFSYVSELERRSLLRNSYPNDILSSSKEKLKEMPPCLYAGFDPTADSLHIGNLLILLNLVRGTHFGCKSVALVGGFTASVGDPSGRNTERDPIQKEILRKNTAAIIEQIQRIGINCLHNTGNELLIVNNDEWFSKMDPSTFIQLFGDFRISQMLKMGAVKVLTLFTKYRVFKSRMSIDAEISLKEFIYQTFQAYDWRQLSDRYNCFFQIGGSDQLGHLDFGAHYIKRTRKKAFAAGICLPLLTDKDGNKLGKSVGGGIWLSANKTSPFHFYQFFRQLHDTEAADLLLKFRFEELHEILAKHNSALGKWIAQEALASELTEIVHGKEGLDSAHRCSRALFQGSTDDVKSLSAAELLNLFGGALVVEKSRIYTMGDFADSTRQDKQKGSVVMTKGAFKVNGERRTDPNARFDAITAVLPKTQDLILVCWGKRNFQLVQLQ